MFFLFAYESYFALKLPSTTKIPLYSFSKYFLMGFSITIDDSNMFPIIHLTDEELQTHAEIYANGALLNRFSILQNGKAFNVVDGFSGPEDAAMNITNGFKSAKLSPFVCRLKKGEYDFEGTHYKINKFYLQTEAIHGLIYFSPFTISASGADETQAFVTLRYAYSNKSEGFPFAYNTIVTYRLEQDNRLIISTTVENIGNGNLPISDGWHPYFTLGESVNDLQVQLNSNSIVAFDEHLLPNGLFTEHTQFSTPTLLGNTFLDNCFVLKDTNSAACILKNNATGLQLSISAIESYPYLQVYTPPHRKSIAVENLSSAPDAFNNHIGLIILQPKETKTFTASYQLSIAK